VEKVLALNLNTVQLNHWKNHK